MKSKSAIAFGLAALVGVSSCVDLEEEIISGVTASYFERPEGFEAAVNAAYAGLWDMYGEERDMTWLEYGVDIWAGGADGGRKYFNTYDTRLEAREAWLRDLWNDTYRHINTTNAVVERAAALDPSQVSDATRTLRVAEAKFLRALYYFYLVRQFGDIPISLEETQGVKTEAHRAPVAEVYSSVIMPDLEAAIAGLPMTATPGRVTRGAAQHMLALAYLTRNDPGDAAMAETLGKAVINSGVYALMPTYGEIWTLANEAGPEVIFGLQSTNDPLTRDGGTTWHLYWGHVYDIEPGMTRTLEYGRPYRRLRPSAYFLDSLFVRTVDDRYDSSFNHVWYANGDPEDLPEGWAVGDTAHFMPGVKSSELDQATYCGKPYLIFTEPDDFWDPQPTPLGASCANVKGEYNPSNFPVLNKYLDPTRISLNERISQRDFLVYRLADTYLMVAEALIRQGKTAEAVPFVNAVRERAAKPGQEAAMRITAADLDLDFILAERARELFGEGHRWFDLVRFDKLVEFVGGRNHWATPNIKPFHVLRPIPQSQIDLTRNEDGSEFPQNPGY
jgi:hypothetical protein